MCYGNGSVEHLRSILHIQGVCNQMFFVSLWVSVCVMCHEICGVEGLRSRLHIECARECKYV